MIQDISPDSLNNAFRPAVPSENDYILLFDDDGRLFVKIQDGRICFTTGRDVSVKETVYLFSVNQTPFFLSTGTEKVPLSGFEYRTVRELRDLSQGTEVFAAFTAYHLWKWYAENRYCGKCGGTNGYHQTERALQCRQCGHVIYPRINPAVIVGVTKGDSLLITRYRTGYAHNALVAGFTEIGETAEQTVQREVMEETGVRVKNIRYYKSQPWGMAQDLLLGFFCEADRDGEIHMDANELKYAEWVNRADIVLQPNNLSLTNDMMKHFKDAR
ncbi:MAG: NAD(+) diphosphatase [Clostridia bacterium]|nr:NAD(+) diphosphatase [Clostridia bacterium]